MARELTPVGTPRPLLVRAIEIRRWFPFKPKLGLSRKVEGVAGAQTGKTVRASLFQRPDPELGMGVYSLALAARARAHKAPTSSQRYNTHALLAAMPAAPTPIALMLALE